MSVVKMKRAKSVFQIITTANQIYTLILRLCLKMPKRYTYLVLQPIIDRADKMCYYVKGAKVDIPHNSKEAQVKLNYLLHAEATLDDLSWKTEFFMDNPNGLTYKDESQNGKTKGITYQNLEQLYNLINKERQLIQEEKVKTRKDFPELIQKEKI